MSTSERVALVGAGLVGASWAVVFARAGRRVMLHDQDEAARDRAKERIRDSLAALARAELVTETVDTMMARVCFAPTLEAAIDGATYVQESVVESLPAKRALLARLDAMTSPEVILASSTSAFATSMLAADIPGHGRCVVVHPVNPPHLIPFVELSGAPFTALDVLDRAEALMRDVGQSPIRLKREIHGFVLNRLQWTLLAEAYRLVADGIVDAEAIDRAIRDGLARRWAFMGPFEVGDLNAPEGLADYFARFGDTIEAIDVSRRETPLRLDPQVISTLHAEQRGRWPDQDPRERAARVQERDAKLLELAVWRTKPPTR